MSAERIRLLGALSAALWIGSLSACRPAARDAVPADLAVGADGTLAVTGSFMDTASVGDGEPKMVTLTSAGTVPWDPPWNALGSAFVARYAADGGLIWARSANNASGAAVAVALDGRILVTGTIRGVAAFDPGSSGEVGINSKGSLDLFVVSYAP